jgi:uncharacterized membrane protein HdeD (DUF308 family)
MRHALIRNWWSLVLRGIVAILLGVITFVWPGITLAGLVILFGAYALVDGIMSIVGAIRASRVDEPRGFLVLEGIVGIGAAVATMLWPAITALALVYIVAAWAIVTGGLEIAAAIELRRHIRGEWLLALGGIASVVFGVLVMMAPLAGALVIALWIGAYAFVFGALMIALGFRLRSYDRTGLAGRPSIIVPAH